MFYICAMEKYYFELQGASSEIACYAYYDYYRRFTGSRSSPSSEPWVQIIDIKRIRDGKSVKHLVERFTGERRFVDNLEDEILDVIQSQAMDYEIFGEI